mmetsp:Transcript_3208/g.9828  ORF Transcript_3208/g.9828 Transcript_3208/m.9828 type:complete len:323 (-) Transcript_3208:543-1511(-)
MIREAADVARGPRLVAKARAAGRPQHLSDRGLDGLRLSVEKGAHRDVVGQKDEHQQEHDDPQRKKQQKIRGRVKQPEPHDVALVADGGLGDGQFLARAALRHRRPLPGLGVLHRVVVAALRLDDAARVAVRAAAGLDGGAAQKPHLVHLALVDDAVDEDGDEHVREYAKRDEQGHEPIRYMLEEPRERVHKIEQLRRDLHDLAVAAVDVRQAFEFLLQSTRRVRRVSVDRPVGRRRGCHGRCEAQRIIRSGRERRAEGLEAVDGVLQALGGVHRGLAELDDALGVLLQLVVLPAADADYREGVVDQRLQLHDLVGDSLDRQA